MPEVSLLRTVTDSAASTASNIPIVGNTASNFIKSAGSLAGDRDSNLKDSTHASRRFSLNRQNFTEVPRPKFLFWLQFFGNGFASQNSLSSATISDQTKRWAEGISFLVKYVDKPKITPQVEELHQYNKKRLIHTSLQYEPITIRFHDSVSDGALHFWQDYFHWYYGDARGKTEQSWNYDQLFPEMNSSAQGWGFNPQSGSSPSITNNFLTEVKLWQFWGGSYTSMSFINPKITMFDHDSNDYAEGAVGSEIQMQMKYEGVIYHAEKASIESSSGMGGLSDQEKQALLLDLGDYYNVPNIRANTDLFSRLSNQALTGILSNVLSGNGANATSVLKNVVTGALPVNAASLNALKNQVYTNTITNVGVSALNTFGGMTFGTATDQTPIQRDTVSDARITSYASTTTSSSTVATRGDATSLTSGTSTPDFTNLAGGSLLDQGYTAVASENESFLESFGGSIASAAKDIGNAVKSGVNSATTALASLVDGSSNAATSGTQLTPQGYAALNGVSRAGTQYGSNTNYTNLTSATNLASYTTSYDITSAG